MIYNMLPGGNTAIHLLYKKGDVIKRIFEICHEENPDIGKEKYEVPFLRNLNGFSPIHLCL